MMADKGSSSIYRNQRRYQYAEVRYLRRFFQTHSRLGWIKPNAFDVRSFAYRRLRIQNKCFCSFAPVIWSTIWTNLFFYRLLHVLIILFIIFLNFSCYLYFVYLFQVMFCFSLGRALKWSLDGCFRQTVKRGTSTPCFVTFWLFVDAPNLQFLSPFSTF